MREGIFCGSDYKRKQTLSKFYERRLDCLSSIPYVGVMTVNNILSELFSAGKMPKHNMVLLKVQYAVGVKPIQRVVRGKKIYDYSSRFFNTLYRIRVGTNLGEKIFRVNLDVKDLVFSWEENFHQEKTQHKLPEVLYCADLTALKFRKATGIALKNTTGRGVFRIGGREVNLGSKNMKKIVLVFFDKGNLFIYDLNGRKIEPLKSR